MLLLVFILERLWSPYPDNINAIEKKAGPAWHTVVTFKWTIRPSMRSDKHNLRKQFGRTPELSLALAFRADVSV